MASFAVLACARSESESPRFERLQVPSGRSSALSRASPVPSQVKKLTPSPLVHVPAGRYRPFYKGTTQDESLPVAAFFLERRPVSREQFRSFVAEQPRFRKSLVQPLFAEKTYLSNWRSDFDLGDGRPEEPVTFVSWFAARAYCQAQGRRLPSVIEWERAATSDASGGATVAPAAPVASGVPSGMPGGAVASAAFQFAMGRSAAETTDADAPVFGEVWEWVSDFNTIFVPKSAVAPASGNSNLLCGDGLRAEDTSDYASFLRYSFRNSLKANYTLKNLGFRCAKDAP